MDIIENIEHEVIESVNMQNKCPPSTRIISLVSFLASSAALILTAIFIIYYLFDTVTAAYLSERMFFPALIIGGASLYMAIGERLRGRYLLITLSLWFASVCLAALTLFVIIQAVTTGTVHVLPL